MKPILVKLLLTTLVYLFSMTSHAALPTGVSKVSLIYPRDSGGVLVRLENQTNPEGCSNNAFYYALSSNNPAFDPIFSVLLAAHHAGSDVQLFVDGCSSWPEITHVQSMK